MVLKVKLVQGHALTCKHVVNASIGIQTLSQDEWADSMRVTEANETEPSQHCGTSKCTFALLV